MRREVFQRNAAKSLGRILAVYAATFGAFARGAGPAADVTWNPYGRFSDQNVQVGNSYAGVANQPYVAGVNQGSAGSSDSTTIRNQLSSQVNEANNRTRYCSTSRTSASDYASCYLAASLVEDTQAAADMVHLRPEVVASANSPTGTADMGHKLGEAARVAGWGTKILETQLDTLGNVILQLLSTHSLNYLSLASTDAPPDRPHASDAALNYISTGVIQTVKVQAAILLIGEWRAMRQTADSFDIAANFNMKGAATLANDVDDTDLHTQQRFGPAMGTTSMGLGAQTAPGSNAPGSRNPGPSRLPSRMGPEIAGNPAASDTSPVKVAYTPVGKPGTIDVAANMTPGQLEQAKQLAYDMLAAQGIEASQLTAGGPLSAGTLGAPKALAGSEALTPGKLEKPESLGNFDRAQAEAAADRYLDAMRRQKPEKLEAGELDEPPPLFAKATQLYKKFQVQAIPEPEL